MVPLERTNMEGGRSNLCPSSRPRRRKLYKMSVFGVDGVKWNDDSHLQCFGIHQAASGVVDKAPPSVA